MIERSLTLRSETAESAGGGSEEDGEETVGSIAVAVEAGQEDATARDHLETDTASHETHMGVIAMSHEGAGVAVTADEDVVGVVRARALLHHQQNRVAAAILGRASGLAELATPEKGLVQMVGTEVLRVVEIGLDAPVGRLLRLQTDTRLQLNGGGTLPQGVDPQKDEGVGLSHHHHQGATRGLEAIAVAMIPLLTMIVGTHEADDNHDVEAYRQIARTMSEDAIGLAGSVQITGPVGGTAPRSPLHHPHQFVASLLMFRKMNLAPPRTSRTRRMRKMNERWVHPE